jgi:hypothetical protein
MTGLPGVRDCDWCPAKRVEGRWSFDDNGRPWFRCLSCHEAWNRHLDGA